MIGISSLPIFKKLWTFYIGDKEFYSFHCLCMGSPITTRNIKENLHRLFTQAKQKAIKLEDLYFIEKVIQEEENWNVFKFM